MVNLFIDQIQKNLLEENQYQQSFDLFTSIFNQVHPLKRVQKETDLNVFLKIRLIYQVQIFKDLDVSSKHLSEDSSS